jgi:thioredoxin 1
MKTINITDQNIQEYLDKSEIIILDFYADWCGPCKSFAPVFEKVSTMYPEIVFGKVNSEKEQILSGDFSIRSIPTIVVLKQGHNIYESSGALFEHSLISLIEEVKKVDVSKLETYQDQELDIQFDEE